MTNLEELKDAVAKAAFGETSSEARGRGICIDCKEEALPKCYSDARRREYEISGLCKECFDKITGG